MMAVKIGSVTVPHGLFLAPMAGMTDGAFRHIARKAGAEYCVSEMISSVAMCYGDRKTATLARIAEDDTPLAIQLFGHDPDMMAKAAYMIASGDYPGCDYKRQPAAIDINMGCPVKKIVSSGDGSALMKKPELAAEIVKRVKKEADRFSLPVTVKIRAGWNTGEITAPDFAVRLASAGADAIYVHARTKDQMYAPPVLPEVIARTRDAVPASVPVIGNGDVRNADDAIRMMNDTGCDGVMIGRAALGDPWIFAETAAKLDGMEAKAPEMKDKVAAALEMVRLMIDADGEAVAVKEARARAAYFVRDMRGAAAVRGELNKAETYEEYAAILSKLL